MASDWQHRRLGDFLQEVSRASGVDPGRRYSLLGCRWYGRGCHVHDVVDGAKLKTKVLNEVREGDITYNKMWVRKGAFAVVTRSHLGLHATTEYPTFMVDTAVANPDFIGRVICSPAFVAAASERCRGTTSRARLNPRDFLDLPVHLPPLAEQRKIAAILSSVDETIEKTEAVIAQLDVVKKAMIEELLTRGVAGNSGPWEVRPLSRVCLKITDGTHRSPPMQPKGCLYVTSKNIRPCRFDLTERIYISEADHREIFARCDVRKGDVLLTKDGASTGNACLNPLDEPFSLLSSVALIRPNPTLLDPRFLVQFLVSDKGRRLTAAGMNGLAIRRLTLDKINRLPVPVPDLESQQLIASAAEAVDQVRSATESELAEINGLKLSLSSSLLCGEIRVHTLSEPVA